MFLLCNNDASIHKTPKQELEKLLFFYVPHMNFSLKPGSHIIADDRIGSYAIYYDYIEAAYFLSEPLLKWRVLKLN